MSTSEQELRRLDEASALTQWREVTSRAAPSKGRRQGRYLLIEQIIAFAAMQVVDPSTQGGSDWNAYHPTLQAIGKALRRSPSSIAAKGANLRGTRANGQANEPHLYRTFTQDPKAFARLYGIVVRTGQSARVDTSGFPPVPLEQPSLDPPPAGDISTHRTSRPTLPHDRTDMRHIDITPPAGVYDTFGRLNYKPWYAIAELVDNATQNFFDHRPQLAEAKGGAASLTIQIDYDGTEPSLRIHDHAHGMGLQDFARALRLNAIPPDRSGRSEFGMGLKTASCWFAERWTVTSSLLGEPVRRTAVMDLAALRDGDVTTVAIDERPASASEHGTTLLLSPLRKPLYGRQINRIKETLASMYRVDLRRGDVTILYNGDPLQWEDEPLWEDELPGYENRVWKQELDLRIPEEATGDVHHVTGWVGILATMSANRSGFALFRRGRLIIGGPGEGWRPIEVVGSSGSHSWKRLVGELHMDTYPVNFSKDGFAWDGQLEEATIKAVAEAIPDYRQKAANLRVRAEKVTAKSLQPTAEVIGARLDKEGMRRDLAKLELPVRTADDPVDDPDKRERMIDRADGPMELSIPQPAGGELVARVYLKESDPAVPWIELSFAQPNEVDVVLNTAHPFIVEHSADEASLVVLQKFALALALAEKRARMLSEPKIYPDDLRTHIDTFLKHFSA